MEDIFEAEDALPPDLDIADLPSDFFSSHTSDPTHPLLHRSVINKLTKLIVKASGKHSRQNARDSSHSGGSPKKLKRTFATVETSTLSRILRILERSVKAGEDLDPFDTSSADMARTVVKCEATPKKASKPKRSGKADSGRSKSGTPHSADEDEGDPTSDSARDATEGDLDAMIRSLELARDSLLAADCCLTLLSSDRLQKQVRTQHIP